MADVTEETTTIDANALLEEPIAENASGTVVTTTDADIVSKAFTSVEEDGTEVQYVTMTPEEAAAAGVTMEEEEQVVTTSLQFDPANPSVLYTADGTLINQADLSPEEQALVQAALQQHLAEQEAEQQLALIEEPSQETQLTLPTIIGSDTTSAPTQNGDPLTMSVAGAGNTSVQSVTGTTAPLATITPATTASSGKGINLASPHTNASQIVQTLADNVRRQQEYLKAQHLLKQAELTNRNSQPPEGYRYEEKIVIRQGQPQVVKLPVKVQKKPEIPAALANLMPKIEVGKDGSQVIRIHQSQISAEQLRSLQENPNVRLVFRPANANKNRPRNGAPVVAGKKRGRPRRVYDNDGNDPKDADYVDESPPSKTRYGRTPKQPYYSKDYTTPIENEDGTVTYPRPTPKPIMVGRRGRTPGSLNKSTIERAYRRSNSYAHKIDVLREQELIQDEDLTNARLAITPQKPVLSSVEQAISTRRKNRLRELLSACSQDEIMEVALPHLARAFSLWEFLIMKVEQNKQSRVYFADVYKEYEALHRYVSRLTVKYKDCIQQKAIEGTKDALEETEKKNLVKVKCKKLAESLGLEADELEDTFINLLDSTPIIPTVSGKQEMVISNIGEQAQTLEDSTTSKDNQETTTVESSSKLIPVTTQAAVQPEMPPLAPLTAESDEKEPAVEASMDTTDAPEGMQIDETETATGAAADGETPSEDGAGGTQIIQIGTGDDKQFIEVPEGYTLIQTPEGLVMSQPGTTLSQAEDGTIYVTQEDGTTAPLDSQHSIPLEAADAVDTTSPDAITTEAQ
uniref:Uncharacterized LOC100178511 n=1 Tax=Ciona intestinalis TaxID=7719 RepID=F6PUK0_CIOIN|nr:uncharacterized protein LOC100178511 [Ciona intestinalis]|eukprot:XP_002129102.1 uncharacterized protein LOC100178511 [Ciona intestinalis]